MDRKKFIKTGAVAGSGLFAGLSSIEAASLEQPLGAIQHHDFNLNYAPHFGMFENHAGADLIDQLKFMADVGFTALEDNGMMGRSPEVQANIGDTLAKLDMTMGVFVVEKGGNGANSFAAGDPEHTEIFLDGCRRAVEVAKRVNAKWMTVVPGNFVRGLPMGVQTANVIDTLRRGAEIFEPHDLVMVLEPLSDTPDLYLRHSDQTYMICEAVNSPSCKLLYDVYHMQRNEGDLINNIDLCWDHIPYMQVGDNPGRNEPSTGEINFENIFKHLYEKDYQGVVGMEHGKSMPGKKGERALIEAYVQADSFLSS